MSKWKPVIISGDYGARQEEANRIGAVCYYEQHMNSYTTKASKYGLVLIAHNASNKSEAWAGDLAKRMGNVTDLPTRVKKLRDGDRGDHNLELTHMPACLGEPGPINHRTFDRWMEEKGNRELLALAVAESIMVAFPEGGKVALSIGHKGKTSAPRDTGAGDSDPAGSSRDQTEAWFAEQVIKLVAMYLAAGGTEILAPKPPAKPPAKPGKPKFPLPSGHVFARDARDQSWRHDGTESKTDNANVKHIQRAVGAKADGIFGPRTESAVKSHQARIKLVADGLVGPKTWATL